MFSLGDSHIYYLSREATDMRIYMRRSREWHCSAAGHM